MKILQIVSAGYEQGGVENGIILTNDILRKRGHVVKVISGDDRPYLKHYSDYEFSGIPSVGIIKFIKAAFNYDAYLVTKKILAEFKPDVVLLHTMSQPTASVLFLLKKYPTLLFIHGPEIFINSLLPWYLPKKNYKNDSFKIEDLTKIGKLRYLYFKYFCNIFYKISMHNVDIIIALSTYTLNILKKDGYEEAIYIPNGVNLLRKGNSQNKSNELLYAGRLEKFKGVDNLIKAMPNILKTFPNVILKIAGTGQYENELKQLTEKLHLENSVKFMGHLNQKQLANTYRKCNVFILPSVWPETFGKVGVEAMSVGKPVIATNVGGVKDWLIDGKNGFLIKPHRPNQIASKVIELLSNKKLAKQMSLSAYETSKKFSILNMTINIESLIKDSLKLNL